MKFNETPFLFLFRIIFRYNKVGKICKFRAVDNDANDLNEVVVLKAEITRLQEQLKDVEKQNKFLNEKLTQQQWDMDHRLAEIEMQICRDTSSVGSSIDDNERNRESVI